MNELSLQHEAVLPRETKLLLAIISINALANSLSNVFVNVFLFRLSDNMYEVALFNFIAYVTWLPAFVFAGWLCKKKDRKIGLIIGGSLQLLFYLAILALAEQAIDWVPLLGFIFGVGSGFYWLSINVLSVDLTSEHNRLWFNGVNGLFGSLSQMLGPFIAGLIVTFLPHFYGYQLIFFLSLILFANTIWLTTLLPAYKMEERFRWRKIIDVHHNREWKLLSLAFVGLSFRDGVISFVIVVWVFMVTGSESVLGNFVFVTTLLSVLTYYIVGKCKMSQSKQVLLVAGNLGLSSALSLFLFDVNWGILIAYGIVAAISIPLFEVPFNTMSLNNIAELDDRGATRVELVISREMALSAGRVSSVGLLAAVYSSSSTESYLPAFLALLIAIGMTPLLVVRKLKPAGKA
ncbi:hypothetical protein M3212_07130 [Alkalihalobacillus oceani]|uniref:MFS transporter n=1 Tax=Halalkalibacter oceani TaxID=1653776 RepID=UPI002040041E|nr:MFS transporter [Halalkalibacter oceani]MCM3760560.1 hypothetical protein [Halalkalibacter oceani]